MFTWNIYACILSKDDDFKELHVSNHTENILVAMEGSQCKKEAVSKPGPETTC